MLKLKALTASLLLGLGAGTAHADTNATLMHIVSLDCQYSAALAESGRDSAIRQKAEDSGINYRIGAWGPVEVLSDVHMETATELFWTAVDISPDSSLRAAQAMFRSFADAASQGSAPGREDLKDDIAVALSIPIEEIRRTRRDNARTHERRWRQTAAIARDGLELSGTGEMITPAFVMIKNEEVVEYAHWTENSEQTEKVILEMIERHR